MYLWVIHVELLYTCIYLILIHCISACFSRKKPFTPYLRITAISESVNKTCYILLLCINHNCYLYMPSRGPDLVNKLILISISIRKNCIRMVFCLFCKKNFYPVLFTLLYFIILVVATSFWWDTKKIKIKMNNSI
jgi:hypothetical protein